MNVLTNFNSTLITTIERIVATVGSTLGPQGKNVILFNNEGDAFMTKDGVSVAKHLNSDNVIEKAIIQIIREASLKTAEEAGDGTTTSSILAGNIILNSIRQISRGKNPAILKKELLESLPVIINKLKELSTPIDVDYDTLKYIATTSANNDATIGNIIAEAFVYAGKEGLVTFDKTPLSTTYVEKLEGTQIDNGVINKDFITDKKKMQTVLENAKVLLIKGSVNNWKEMLPIAQAVKDTPTVVVAFDFSENTLRGIIRNNFQGFTNILPIRLTGYTANREDLLNDLSAITTASVCSVSNFENKFGTIHKVISTQTSTTFILDSVVPDSFYKRIEELKAQIEDSRKLGDSYVKSAEKRLAKFVGKIATIYVGGSTELEAKERYDRVEDAVCATKSALEEGICNGGATTFINIAAPFTDIESYSDGFNIILIALFSPFRKLCQNAGLEYKDYISGITNEIGYDFSNFKYVNMLEAGIIDPTKVIRNSIENAISVAALLINTDYIVDTINENSCTS